MKKNKGRIWMISGLLLVAAALLLTSYNLWDEHRADGAAKRVLGQLLPEIPEDVVSMDDIYASAKNLQEIEYPDYVLNPNMEMPVKNIDGADYIAVLTIPFLGIELPVMGEWSYPNLKISPCRYAGSAYTDDLVICAHNYTKHFGKLKGLTANDTVILTDMDGNVFNYRVVEMEILKPTDTEKIKAGDWDLTLFTCTIGNQSRVTVRCEKIIESSF